MATDAEALLPRHRATIAQEHRGRGREVLSLDWTYAHHDRGPNIWGVKQAWNHVEKRLTQYQTVVTAVIANRALIDGVEVVVQHNPMSGQRRWPTCRKHAKRVMRKWRTPENGYWNCCTTVYTSACTRSERR
jgi:hypothetical protein